MKFSRVFCMPNSRTFEMAPVARFIKVWAGGCKTIADPFAADSQHATHSNDIRPTTSAKDHMDARDWLSSQNVIFDCVLLDPPYSPRQISECYKGIGRHVTKQDTQSPKFMKEVRECIMRVTQPYSFVLSFGWNSVGMGPNWEIEEIMLVTHGGAHNDTICMCERRVV